MPRQIRFSAPLFGALTTAALFASAGVALAQPAPRGGAPGPAAPPPPTPSATPASPAPATPVDASYALGAGDTVEISLVGRNDFMNRVRVSTDGTILLPLIGRIKVEGRTVLELGDDVRQALIKGGFYADPVVRADVVSISSRYATVLGAVGTPGLLPLDRNYHLSEVLARVGGRGNAGADYVVLTHAGGESKKYSVNELATGGNDKDPVVQPGDKIFVPSGEAQMFYVSGMVNNPGGYPASEGLTVRMAIARGGGVNENGSEKKVTLVRSGKELKGVKLEDPVLPGDVLKIGERLF